MTQRLLTAGRADWRENVNPTPMPMQVEAAWNSPMYAQPSTWYAQPQMPVPAGMGPFTQITPAQPPVSNVMTGMVSTPFGPVPAQYASTIPVPQRGVAEQPSGLAPTPTPVTRSALGSTARQDGNAIETRRVMTNITSSIFDRVSAYTGVTDVYDWLLEYRRAVSAQGVTNELALVLFDARMKDLARQWWEEYRITFATWEQAANALQARFFNEPMDSQLHDKWVACKHEPDEDLSSYFLKQQRGFTRWQPNATERDRVSKYISGLQGELGAAMVGLERRPETMADAHSMASRKQHSIQRYSFLDAPLKKQHGVKAVSFVNAIQGEQQEILYVDRTTGKPTSFESRSPRTPRDLSSV